MDIAGTVYITVKYTVPRTLSPEHPVPRTSVQRRDIRYTVIDRSALLDYFAIASEEQFHVEHNHWVEEQLRADGLRRKELWSESIAVGSKGFVENIQQQLRARAVGRSVVEGDEGCTLKEVQVPYGSHFGNLSDE